MQGLSFRRRPPHVCTCANNGDWCASRGGSLPNVHIHIFQRSKTLHQRGPSINFIPRGRSERRDAGTTPSFSTDLPRRVFGCVVRCVLVRMRLWPVVQVSCWLAS
jgi:hypothetical protein